MFALDEIAAAMLGLAALASCGDNATYATDAGQLEPLDAARADAGPSLDADTRDAAPQPDAIPGFTCSSALDLASGSSHIGDTTVHSNGGFATCSTGSATSNDAVYRVALPTEATDLIARVIVDEGATQPFDAVLAIQTTCGDEDTEVACSDFGFSESAEALAMTGEAFVHVDGTAQFGGAATGHYQLDVHTRTIVAQGLACDMALRSSRCDTGLRCIAGLCESDGADTACDLAQPLTGGQEVSGTTHAFEADHFQGSCAFDAMSGAPERIFTVSIAQTSDLLATTDFGSTRYDTVLYLVETCGGLELGCSDDVDVLASNFRSTLEVSALPPGDYLLVVDGSSPQAPQGDFRLRLDITPL